MVLDPEFFILGLEGFVGGTQRGDFHIHDVHIVAVQGRDGVLVADRDAVVAPELVRRVGIRRVENRKEDIRGTSFVGAPVNGIRIGDKGKRVFGVVRTGSLLERGEVAVQRKEGAVGGERISVIGNVGAVQVEVDGLPSGNTYGSAHKVHILLDGAVNHASLGVFLWLGIGV